MRIAVDAMGGDYAPKNVVEGVHMAIRDFPQIEKIYLVGDQTQLKALVDQLGIPAKRVEIVHSTQVVEMHESSIMAVRHKRDSSVSISVDLVKRGDAAAVVSAGHTGAAVAATTIKLRTLPGVDRPGICSPLPSDHGVCNILDAGANPDAKPAHLLHYAIMGSVYCKHALGVANPKVGLMSVGEEDEKGNELTREVFRLLKDAPINFKGNVEGHDLYEGGVDVVLCDGFTGNVVLKSAEATAKALFKWLKHELTGNPMRYAGAMLAKGAFKAIKDRSNYETYGGSPLLGVNGICIICHGRSSPLAIRNGIRVAMEAITHEVNPHIQEEIARLNHAHA